jgi:ABC-type multidrug transport system fused ATPase/permease subunit
MKGQITVVMIAHRLSTVVGADRIYYVDNGEIRSEGTFSEVRAAVPEFDRQAKLMGL